jgi:hypothetical protein
MLEDDVPLTLRSTLRSTLRLWAARFTPLSLTMLAVVYSNQLIAAGLDVIYRGEAVEPLMGWAIRFFGGWAATLLTGAVGSVILIRMSLPVLGQGLADQEGHGRAIGRHAIAVALIYLILAPGEIVADMFPPAMYLAISIAWSFAICLLVCADVARVAEGRGVREALRRSYRLLRPHLRLALGMTLLWEAAAWIPFLILNPQFLSQGSLNPDPGARWVIAPMVNAASYLFAMLGSIVLFVETRGASQDETARVFD